MQGVRGAGVEPVATEVEVGERRAEREHRGENGDAAVAEVVVREVEVAQAAAGGEDRDECVHALQADVVAGHLEVREGRGMAEAIRDDCGADGPEAVAAGDFEALQVRAELEDAAQAVDFRLVAEQGERGDGGALTDFDEPLQDEGEPGGVHGICPLLFVPVEGAHAQRGREQHGVDGVLHALGDAAQHVCVLVAASQERGPPHVGRDGCESILEGVQHVVGKCKGQRAKGKRAEALQACAESQRCCAIRLQRA